MTKVVSSLVVVHVFPRLLGLYGDRGNAMVIVARARARGLPVELLTIDPGQPVPRQADIYLLGGAEDTAQAAAARLLREDGGLVAVAGRGAVVLAVCAGLQLLGTEFDAAGKRVEGLGLVDAMTVAHPVRAVGELVVEPCNLPIGKLTGFENHSGHTHLGPGVVPLGRVLTGVGNGTSVRDGEEPHGIDGFVQGNIVGTYSHGPVLARNPSLADLLVQWATGWQLADIDDHLVTDLREERLNATVSSQTSWLANARARLPRRSGPGVRPLSLHSDATRRSSR